MHFNNAKDNSDDDETVDKKTYRWRRLIRHPFVQLFLPKLVLEVFGAAGAIWGFSEAVGLRTSATNWFWRPAAMMVGGLFWMRWIVQVRRSLCRSRPHENMSTAQTVAAHDSISSIHSRGSLSSSSEDEMTALVSHALSPIQSTSGKSIAPTSTNNNNYATPTKAKLGVYPGGSILCSGGPRLDA